MSLGPKNGKKVLITGAGGIIGSALREHLVGNYEFVYLVHREAHVTDHNYKVIDVLRDYRGLKKAFEGQDVVVHLAITREEPTTLNNMAMTNNVYRAAYEAKVPRVIMASSIHAAGGYWAEDFYYPPHDGRLCKKLEYRYIANRELDKVKKISLVSVDKLPYPDSYYAATKVYMEALGKYYSDFGLSVVCIRFGGVNRDDSPLTGLLGEIGYHSIWFSHKDVAQLVGKCIDATNLPPFVIFFGVSNNKYCILDISNSRRLLGYKPEDDAETFLQVSKP